MARKLFVAATGQHCGKTAISVCLLHLARRRGLRVGFVKPVGQRHVRAGGIDVDKDVALMARLYALEGELPLMSPVVVKRDVTRRAIDGEVQAATFAAAIERAVAELERRVDLLIVEGTGHGGVGSVIGLDNAQVARLLGAPVLIVTEGGIGRAVDSVALNLALYRQAGVAVRGVVLNKLLPDKRASTVDYAGRAFAARGLALVPGLDYSPVLADPTLASVAQLFGVPLRGDPACASRIAHYILLGAASTQRVVDLLRDATLLVTTGSRDELIVTMAALYNIAELRARVAGLVITGLAPLAPITQRILDESGMPYLVVETQSGDVFRALGEHVAKLGPDDREKLAHLQAQAERTFDLDAILALV